MGKFYCRACAAKRGMNNVTIPSNPTGTVYQWERFTKHTTPTANYPVNSIFDNPSEYHSYQLSASASGCFEIDDQNRHNLVLNMGKRIGETTGYAHPYRVDSAVKVVCYNIPTSVHAFPTASDLIETGRCADCNQPLNSF